MLSPERYVPFLAPEFIPRSKKSTRFAAFHLLDKAVNVNYSIFAEEN
jgi:hypothetical protein